MWQSTVCFAVIFLVAAFLNGGQTATLKLVMTDKSEAQLLSIMQEMTKLLNVQSATLPGPIETEVTFSCSSGSGFQRVLLNDDDLHERMSLEQPVAFIIHGWTSGSDALHFQDMARNYSRFVGGNVCLVDWSNLAKYESRFLRFLKLNGLNYANVTLIGHSLGAQISSFVGKSLNGQIGQIYGLDPAGPLFTYPEDVGPNNRLAPSDAGFVQVIYTSKGTLSMTVSGGHQNFYMNDNGESPQPSCADAGANKGLFTQVFTIITCSHTIAVAYFTASLDPNANFTMKRCSYYWMWKTGLCVLGAKDKVGIWSQRVPGDFYGTNDMPYPYAL